MTQPEHWLFLETANLVDLDQRLVRPVRNLPWKLGLKPNSSLYQSNPTTLITARLTVSLWFHQNNSLTYQKYATKIWPCNYLTILVPSQLISIFVPSLRLKIPWLSRQQQQQKQQQLIVNVVRAEVPAVYELYLSPAAVFVNGKEKQVNHASSRVCCSFLCAVLMHKNIAAIISFKKIPIG